MTKLRVLVVESDSATQKRMEDRLLCSGHRVVIIGSVEIALDYLMRREFFNIVFIGEPVGTTGRELFVTMRGYESLNGVPIVFYGKTPP